MAVFVAPPLLPDEQKVLKLITESRKRLERYLAEPRRWMGGLRRMALARAVQASNSIEGYNASLDDVIADVDGSSQENTTEEAALAVSGYRNAMTFVLQRADEEAHTVDEGLLKSLHFMMIGHDLAKNPGQWRPGPVYVQREPVGEIVYEGPDRNLVPGLIDEMLQELERSDVPTVVRAAVAHLNLVMIHPFSDGNGRMSRCLQTLVLAREQPVTPVFSSIEEYLGRNTQDYYAALQEVGRRSWNPHRSAHPWIRFCLTAHFRQATTHERRIDEVHRRWLECGELARQHRLPARTVAAISDAALGLQIRNQTYRELVRITEGEEISMLTASRDLKALVDAGLLTPHGAKKGRYYLAAAEPVKAIQDTIRANRPPREDNNPLAA